MQNDGAIILSFCIFYAFRVQPDTSKAGKGAREYKLLYLKVKHAETLTGV